MIGEDEIIFSGSYKDFDLNLRFNLSNAKNIDVVNVLMYINNEIEPSAFKFSEIKTEIIDSLASPAGKSLKAVIDFLNSNPQAKIKKELQTACPVPELMPAAESYFFNRLLTKAEVGFKVGASSSTLKSEKEEPGKVMIFVGKFGEWTTIKKTSLKDTKDWEVSAFLCGVNYTLINKSFDFAGTEKNDALISKLASGRKSFGNLVTAVEKLQEELTGDSLTDAYMVNKLFVDLGYPPYATPSMLVKAHPDVKPPKPKGRMPKS